MFSAEFPDVSHRSGIISYDGAIDSSPPCSIGVTDYTVAQRGYSLHGVYVWVFWGIQLYCIGYCALQPLNCEQQDGARP